MWYLDAPADVGIKDQGYLEARTKEKRFRAANQKLEFEIKTDKYILKSKVKDANFKAGRIFRDALLNVGPRTAPLLAAERNEAKVLKIMKKEFTDILNEMVRMLNAAMSK